VLTFYTFYTWLHPASLSTPARRAGRGALHESEAAGHIRAGSVGDRHAFAVQHRARFSALRDVLQEPLGRAAAYVGEALEKPERSRSRSTPMPMSVSRSSAPASSRNTASSARGTAPCARESLPRVGQPVYPGV